jgi:hypothetical protein
MKKILSIIAGLALLAPCAHAQFDAFADFKTIVFQIPTNYATSSSATATVYSNSVIDISGFEGVAKIDITGIPNNSTNTIVPTIYTSKDQTNWTAMANYAIATLTTIKVTNYNYATALYGTNFFNWPGTVTTPTAATAGFANKYTLAAPFTNSGAISTLLTNTTVTIGFNTADQPRYLQMTWAMQGTNAVAATYTGRLQNPPY